LEEGEVSVEDVVEVDLRICPAVVEVGQREAFVARRHHVVVNSEALGVDAMLEAAAEQVHAHYAEDKPEHETDKQHVEDGRNCLNQCVDDHLQMHTVNS